MQRGTRPVDLERRDVLHRLPGDDDGGADDRCGDHSSADDSGGDDSGADDSGADDSAAQSAKSLACGFRAKQLLLFEVAF